MLLCRNQDPSNRITIAANEEKKKQNLKREKAKCLCSLYRSFAAKYINIPPSQEEYGFSFQRVIKISISTSRTVTQ